MSLLLFCMFESHTLVRAFPPVELTLHRNKRGYHTHPGPTFKFQHLRSEEGANSTVSGSHRRDLSNVTYFSTDKFLAGSNRGLKVGPGGVR